MIIYGNGHDDDGMNDDSSVICFFGKHQGHSRTYPVRGKNRISLDLNANAGGKSTEATDGTNVVADEDDEGGDDDPDPDRRPRKPVFHKIDPALLQFASLSQYVGFGRSRIYQLIFEGTFPRPIKVGKSSRWVRAEIDKWLEQQIAARQQPFSRGSL